MSKSNSHASSKDSSHPARIKRPGADNPHSSEPGGAWRRLFQRQLTVSIVAFAGLLTLVGSLLLGFDLTTMHGDIKTVFLEVAVALILFGTTTLFVTVAVADSLETRLVASIKEILKSEKDELVKINNDTQQAVQDTQEDLRPLGGNWRALGLTNVYLTRSDALDDFGEHIRNELRCAEEARLAAKDRTRRDGRDGIEGGQAGKPRLWIAASSMKGLLESASMQFDGLGIFAWAAALAAQGKLDLRIIMTHPEMARSRAGQEDRGPNAIPEEIEDAVNHLKREKVPPEYVKMVVATPTVFAIATRDQMLLNPYPYSQEAYRSFTLTVRRSHTKRDIKSIDRDIFEQYERRHFDRPWVTALPLRPDYGIPKLPPGTVPPPAIPVDVRPEAPITPGEYDRALVDGGLR